MNRIYNVIWSKTKKCYVVVSEIVKSSGGKVKSLHTGKTYTHVSTVMAVAALLAGVNITSVNAAAIMIDNVNNSGYATGQAGGNKWSYLYNYNNPGNMSALDGTATTGYYSGSALNGISIGHNTKIQEASDPTYYSGVAIGDYAQATGGLSFSLGNYAQSTKPSAMAIGTASLSSGFNSLAMMRQSAATGNFSTAIGTTSWASGTGSFALGYSAQSKGDQSIAIGAAEPITVAGSGNEPSAAYNGTTNTVTEGARSLAFGTKARTTAAATDSMAFGSNAKTKAANAVAMGNSSRATGTDSFAFGNTASAAGTNAIAMGRTAQASKANAIALGGQAQALEANALAIGSTATASKAGTMAIGTASKASSNNSTAIGNGAEVTGENSMALGSGAKISANNSIALGAGTEFNDPLVNTYAAFTNEMNPAESGVVAVGNSGTPRRIVNVAGGQNDNDAATIKQLRYVNNNLAQTIAGPTYTGYEANGSTYKAPDFSIKNSTYHTVKEAVEAAQTNFFSAKGTSADANYDNKGATGTNATAAGVRASAAGNFGTALGADATATSDKSTALGYKAKVTEDDGVALGSYSVANTAAGVAGYDVSAADNRANRYTDLTGSVATSTLGAVSVGQSTSVGTETRQITNLAAGTKDTDAVNVAQLRNVNLKIAGNTNDNNGKNDVLLDKQTLTVKGDGTYVMTKANNQTIDVTLTNDTKNKIDNAANKDLSNINNDGKTVIREEAQKAVKVIAGQNTTVTEGTDGTYKTYAVNVASAGDYRLVENSVAADKAYTVTGNKVDLTVQDGSTPANTKTVTIKDIASKTELDSTKSELTTKINDTKTELINKGLKFNADNNDVKTNKLGSTVTVSGDANITTKITQTGDDSTIAVALNKDLNVNTVTATNTVKAGTATMGNQSATDNKGATQTGNFVTGLDNTAWNMANPVFVSGRAATEDQLKTVSDAVRAANAGSSDYRLIENDTATDKAYTVTSNKVDLKVKDDKSGTTNTVTIKDIASKTELDKLDDRAVKYDLDPATNAADKSKVTYEGPTYNSTNKTGGTHVTNVAYATGNDGSEAVNVDYLTDKIKDSSDALINKGLKFDANVGGVQTNKLGSTVTVQGEGAEADANYSGKNIKTFITQNTTTGNTTIDVKMNKNLEVETVTATGANGKDGKIGINGKDGVTTNLSITRDGKPGVDGVAGTTTTRIVYEKPDGTTEEVATLNDGLKFKGDMGATSNVKLNKQVDVTGGVTNAADLATGNNIGVTSAVVDAQGNAKLQLQLAKDITGLKSVTATDTVKAGTATVGNQSATDNKGANQTGNFVTGLDNTSWNMADPVFVSGRAATEDQLKTVSDAVKAASASAADYRLVENDAATDKAYTVTGNKVDLKVKDEKSGTTKTVTIKDIASKTELDKLDDRAVKYDLDPATNTADKSKVTYEGPTYNSTNKTGGTHVTNVAYATGNDGSEAVNVDYLTDKIKDSSDALINKGLKFDANVGGAKTNKLGSTITVQGEGTEADTNYSGENIKTFIKQDTTTGNTTIDVKLNKNLVADSIKINKDGKDGKDGVSITGPTGVAGQDGNNGKVGITGADGKDAVSISGKDGVGHIGLTGPAGTNGKDGSNGIDMSVKNGYDDAAKGVKGEKGVDGVDGITRIVYTDNTGEHQVATMDDGMLYGGDTGTVIKKKLNNQVNVKGGITDPAKFTVDDNIGVVSDGADTLKVRLAKDLKGLNSVTATETVKAGDVVMGKQSDGTPAANTGNYVTGLDNKDWDVTNPTAVSGRAATEDQLKKVTDAINNQSANVTDYRLIKNQAAGSNGDYTVDNNGDVALTVQDKNHTDQTETVTIKDVASKSNLDKLDDRAVKYDLDPATNTADKSKVTYEGPTYNSTNKTGGTHVTNVAYATGNDGSEAVNVDYLTDKIKDSSDALINKGLKFDANVGGVQTNKLGSTITVQGEGTEADTNYSGENIKTFIKQDTTTGNTTIDVKLNKNLVADSIKVNKDGKDGKDGVSITGPTGVAGQDGNNGKVGITGADGKDAVSISGKDGVGHIGLTGPAGTNGINGTNGIDMSVKNGYDDAAKGVKGEKGVDGVDGITRIVYTDNNGEHQVATMDDGMLYGGDSGTVIKKKLNNQVNVKGGVTDATKLSAEDNIGVISDGTDTLMLRLAKDLKGLNSATFNNGTDGNTVVNGGGMTINDAAGNPLTSVTKDGITITDGPSMTKDGIDAGDKKITNVADGIIGAGSKDAVNGGQLHTAVEEIKTKGFGLTAEDGASVKKPLGDTVTVKGDGTNITTSVDNGAVKVALARDLNVDTVTANTVTTGDTKMDTNGVTIKDGANEATKLTKDGLQINDGGNKAVTINKDGLTIENGPKITKDGIDAGDKKITNVADGIIGAGSKDAVNGGQLHTAMEDIKAQGFGLKAEDGQSVKKPLGEVIDLKGDGNIKTTVDGTAIKMSLNDKITLGTDPAKQITVDGSTGTITAGNGANQVTIDGSTGSVTAGNTVKAGDVIMGNQNSGGQNGNFVTGLDNKTWNPNNPVAVTGRAATEDQLKAVNDDFNEKAKNGRVFQGDQAGNDGKVVRGLGDTMNLKGGADVNRLSNNNIAVVKNAGGDGYDIKLAKDLNLKDGSTTYTKTVPGTNTTIPYTVDTKVDGGGITITPSINGQPVPGHTVSLTENGLNNGNNTITNVAPGINGTDAVNVNQLRNAMSSVDGKIADVGAASAAMAGLKPLQYDPLEPTQVLAAVGNYKGSTAAAIGLAHYTNESTLLHMGVSLGAHDNMVNAGISYKFGTSDAKKAIPARYKGGPISSAYVMQDEVTALKAENLRMKQRDEELSAKYEQVQRDNEEMKAQIAMLMKQVGLTK